MSPAKLIRWSGLALLAGGIGMALFVLVHPQDEFTANVMASRIAEVAHTLHFLGATLAVFGVVGLLLRQVEHGGRLGYALWSRPGAG